MGRILTSGLDLLRPHTSHPVQKAQDRQKASHDVNTTPRTFRVGDTVLATSRPTQLGWKVRSPTLKSLHYMVKLRDGQTIQRHVDHILRRDSNPLMADGPFDLLPLGEDPPEVAPDCQPRQSQRTRRSILCNLTRRRCGKQWTLCVSHHAVTMPTPSDLY